jgi:hypothetical protein
MGARPWLAHTQHEYARFLLDSADEGDRNRAGQLLEDARATADGLGMIALQQELKQLG